MKKYLIILSLIIGNFLIAGVTYSYSASGYMKCEALNSLVEENNSEVKNTIMFWFSGYYTGRNYETSSYPSEPNPELVYTATVNFCKKNPLKDTVDIAEFLYSSLI